VTGDWLLDVLALNAWRNLDTEASRRDLADEIAKAFPRWAVAQVIASSARCVLRTRGVADPDGRIARELGNNSAQGLESLLEPGVEIDDVLQDITVPRDLVDVGGEA
jgi:hypothetical protein